MRYRSALVPAVFLIAGLMFAHSPLSGRTYSPWVVSEHVADFSGNWHSFMQHKAFIGKQDHELAVAVWKYLSSRETGLVHTGSWDEPTRTTDAQDKPDPWGNMFTYWTVYDPVKNINSFGMGYCGMQSTIAAGIFRSLGYESRTININSGYSHQVCEVFYRGGWHFIDTDERGVVLTPGGELASWAQMKAHPEWWPHRPFADAPHFPDHFERFGGLVKEGKLKENGYKYRWEPLGHTMDFVLRMGESYTRWWRADSTRYYKGWWGRSDQAGEWLRNNVREHPEHMYTHKQKGEYGSIYERPGMGVFRYSPKLSSAWQDYRDGVYADSNVVQDEHGVCSLEGGGYTVFKVYTPWIIAGRNGPDPGAEPPKEGVIVNYKGEGGIRVFLSPDFGEHWDPVGQGTRGRIDLTEKLYGRWGCLVRFELEAARLETLEMTTWVQVAPMSLPAVRGATRMQYRTGDRTGEKTAVLPLVADFILPADSLRALGWLKIKGEHRRFNLHDRSDGAMVTVRPPAGSTGNKLRWLTVGGDFNNLKKPEIWVSTTGHPEDLRLLRRLEAPLWCDHWMSRLDEYLGPPDTIPNDLMVDYRKNVNNVRIYAHYSEPERPVKDSPVEVTHCVGGVETKLVVRSDTTYTLYGEGPNEWIRMRVLSEPANQAK
ncbi:MAG TPA: hypothetical protein VM123_18545 [archaeon]|nr:hypothetical protein [archaeon]